MRDAARRCVPRVIGASPHSAFPGGGGGQFAIERGRRWSYRPRLQQRRRPARYGAVTVSGLRRMGFRSLLATPQSAGRTRCAALPQAPAGSGPPPRPRIRRAELTRRWEQ